MKSNQQVQPTIAEDFSAVSFEVRTKGTKTLDMAKVSPEVKLRAACVGLAQVRVVDVAAVSRTDKAGRIRTEDEMLTLKWERICEMVDYLETGATAWSRARPTSGATGGYLFEALCEMYAGKQTPEQVRTFLDGLTDKEQAALRDDDTVSPIIAAIKRARNAGKSRLDTASILQKLEWDAKEADARQNAG